MTVKTIFLDRDGVINKEVNYLSRIEDFEFIDGVFDACRHFEILGYSIIIITNQSGIGRGYYSENDYQVLTKWMLSKFNENNIEILDIFLFVGMIKKINVSVENQNLECLKWLEINIRLK